MADRYWVGGAGTWNSTNTANWSTTSGGAGGASAPTSADNVIFDANSGTGTVTATGGAGNAVCNDLTCTATQALTLSSTGVYIYGSVDLPSGGSAVYSGLAIYFKATTTGKTVSIPKTIGVSYVFDGIGGGWSLTSPLTSTGTTLTLTNGALDLNNQNISFATLESSNATIRSLTLGSSTLTLTGNTPVNFLSSTNLTFNAGTSTINCTGSSGSNFYGGGRTFYNVNFTGGGTGTATINGANTFNNLSVTATTAGTRTIAFAATQTINGTLSTSGTTATQRVKFGSSVAGTQRTLTVANSPTATNSNFQDIALTGAASPWSAPVGVWDLGNNSGITFDTTTLYWIGGTGTWSDGTHWSASSGGAAANVVPGPTNNAIFDASSGTGTITLGSSTGYCKDFTSSSTSVLTFSGTLLVYGSIAFGTNGTYTSTSITWSGTGSSTINAAGKTFQTLLVYGAGGTLTLSNSLTLSNIVNIAGSSFNTAGYAVSAPTFQTGSGTNTISLGSSTITAAWNLATGTNTLNAGTSTINCTYFYGGNLTYYNVTITGNSGNIPVDGTNTYNNLTLTSPTSAGIVATQFSGNQTINGTFTASGSVANRRIYVMPSNLSNPFTITAAAASLGYVDFYRVTGAGAASWVGTSIGDCGGNSGITFTAPKTVYWNYATGGDFFSTNAWATSSGGTPSTANFPLPQDTAIIENTGLNTSASILQGSNNAALPSVDFSSRTNAMTFGWNAATYVCGNLTYGSGVTNSGVGVATFASSTTLTSASKTFTAPITIAAGATLTNSGALTSSSSLTNNGTLTLGANATFTTCTLGASSTTNFSTNKITLTGNNATIFTGNATQTATGTPVIDCNYSGATGTRTISPSTPTEANAISFNITAGTDSVALSGSVKDLNFTGFAGTFTNVARSLYGNLTVSTGMTLTAGANATTFAATSGTKTITTNSKTLGFPLAFNGVGGTWQLVDNLTVGAQIVDLTNGTLDLNGKVFTVGNTFRVNAGTKNITFNGGTLLITTGGTAFNLLSAANFTTTAGTGTGKISLSAAGTKIFSGNGGVYNCTLEQAGAGAVTISGSNTFTTISNSVQPTTFTFTSGTTQTVTNFSVSGTSGNLVTLQASTAGSQFTLSKSSGVVDVSYCSIKDSAATGGARWQAYTTNGNVNGGNNSGWKFSAFSGNGLFFGSNF